MNTDQSKSDVEGDQIAGNKIEYGPVTINNHPMPDTFSANALETLAAKLTEEKLSENVTDSIIDSLNYYKRRRTSTDGIVGLEAKLDKGGRDEDYDEALEQKVLFERLLEEWSYYVSAQEIFAHLLSRINRKFRSQVFPHVSVLPKHIIDDMVDKNILEPAIMECSAVQEFHVNYDVALGMYYWLADQCFVRWHQ
ncbi:ABC-three component system protein [Roseivivax marinus]|uniref:ABC-three component system protein n=1 Tax=Roseivivax marinus TaxID=1379903 RepID=UPI000B82153F|nr:ABC-three component system protein [Roseivivax marinus]